MSVEIPPDISSRISFRKSSLGSFYNFFIASYNESSRIFFRKSFTNSYRKQSRIIKYSIFFRNPPEILQGISPENSCDILLIIFPEIFVENIFKIPFKDFFSIQEIFILRDSLLDLLQGFLQNFFRDSFRNFSNGFFKNCSRDFFWNSYRYFFKNFFRISIENSRRNCWRVLSRNSCKNPTQIFACFFLTCRNPYRDYFRFFWVFF